MLLPWGFWISKRHEVTLPPTHIPHLELQGARHLELSGTAPHTGFMTAGYLLMIPESPVMHRALFKCARVNKWREQCAFQSAGVSVLQMCPWLGPQCRHLLKITVVSTGTARSPPPRTPAPEPRELRARILHQCIGGSPGWGAGGRAGLGPPGAGAAGGREREKLLWQQVPMASPLANPKS